MHDKDATDDKQCIELPAIYPIETEAETENDERRRAAQTPYSSRWKTGIVDKRHQQ